MTQNPIKYLSLVLVSGCLSACTGFFDTDNTPKPTPLTSFQAEATPHQVFSISTGSNVGSDYLKLTPAIAGNAIYTTSVDGKVTALDKRNGNIYWTTKTKLSLSAGPALGEGTVAVVSRRGDVVLLNATTGQEEWRSYVEGEILAAPAITAHRVIVKTTDGALHALAINNGHIHWTFQQTEPNLILRGASAPRAKNGFVYVGFANGNLAKVGVNNGQAYWSKSIAKAEGAFAIQRMIDIDADPLVDGERVLAATYQGRIASLQTSSGSLLWSHDISSYTGMTVSNDAAYITDAKSHLWAFGINNGLVNWRQRELEARNITAPAMMYGYVVVGDSEGYVHWINRHDGHFAARARAGDAIHATPLVDNGIAYIYTDNGKLIAYSLS